MVTEPHFQLTTKDHAILQTILERHRGPRGPYILLLELKLRESAIFFRDDIPPGVVTLDTRLTYRVDGVVAGPHLIVQSEGSDLPAYALSIHTLRGLALLGLCKGKEIAVDIGNGLQEVLMVEEVLSQPEGEAKVMQGGKGVAQSDGAGRTDNVLSFGRKPGQAAAVPAFEPDDDDPGPRAA